MFTNKDITVRSVFVINCIKDRNLRVSSGELLLEESVDNSDKMKTLTKMPFQKILALFVIGHIKITTPLIEKCRKFNVALVVVKPSFRPVFFWADAAEANYLLRQRQYLIDEQDITLARILIHNKIANQLCLLKKTRCKDTTTIQAMTQLSRCIETIPDIHDYKELMGTEGLASKYFFAAYYQKYDWHVRRPRTKCDYLNATLDIGYTILFNYVECFLRMFGFDLYRGVFHRQWFKRKSLVCDIVEPFRAIIDHTIHNALGRKQITAKDFKNDKGEYRLRFEKNGDYTQLFFQALIPYKNTLFLYVQQYYRCFMRNASPSEYPQFQL